MDRISQRKINNDDLISYILLKKLLQPVNQTDAYKLGLVDISGKVVRDPETDVELSALTSLDQIIFEMKSIMSGRINQFYKYVVLNALSDSLYKNLTTNFSYQNRPEITKMKEILKQNTKKRK
jgi:hypothetical protein